MNDFDNGRIRLMQGDCLERMKEIPDQSIDLILTDPPYGTTACKWDSVIPFDPMWEQLKRIIKPKGAIVLFGSQPFTSALVMSNPELFKYEWSWYKPGTGTGYVNAKNKPMQYHENILVFSKGTTANRSPNRMNYYPQGLKEISARRKITSKKNTFLGDRPNQDGIIIESKFENYPRSFIEFKRESKLRIHPTQKPVALLEYLIRTYTQEDEIVLDFTYGSCSTGIAAVNTNRRFIGIELDETYYQLGLARIQQHLEELAGRML